MPRGKKKKTAASEAMREVKVFTRGGERAGRVRTGASAEGFSPADRAAKRAEKEDEKPQLARKLTAIAAAVHPGRSAIGAAISGGLSGAAIGATIGEEISAAKRRKAKKRKRDGQS